MHIVADNIVTAIAAWVIGAATLGLFVQACWVVWSSSIFKRKFWWTLAVFVAIPAVTFALPGMTMGWGVPVGALVVLWRRQFGASTPQQRQADEARRPKSVAELLRSRAGYGAALLAAYCIALLGAMSGPLAAPMLAASIGLVWMANRHRGQRLARPRAALIASLSWGALVLLVAAVIAMRLSGPLSLYVAAAIFVVMWPLILCTAALVQNSWSLPRPDPEPASAG